MTAKRLWLTAKGTESGVTVSMSDNGQEVCTTAVSPWNAIRWSEALRMEAIRSKRVAQGIQPSPGRCLAGLRLADNAFELKDGLKVSIHRGDGETTIRWGKETYTVRGFSARVCPGGYITFRFQDDGHPVEKAVDFLEVHRWTADGCPVDDPGRDLPPPNHSPSEWPAFEGREDDAFKQFIAHWDLVSPESEMFRAYREISKCIEDKATMTLIDYDSGSSLVLEWHDGSVSAYIRSRFYTTSVLADSVEIVRTRGEAAVLKLHGERDMSIRLVDSCDVIRMYGPKAKRKEKEVKE